MTDIAKQEMIEKSTELIRSFGIRIAALKSCPVQDDIVLSKVAQNEMDMDREKGVLWEISHGKTARGQNDMADTSGAARSDHVDDLELSVFEVVGHRHCFTGSDGDRLYDILAAAVRKKKPTSVSFMNIDTLTPAFLNAAIGRLFGEFGIDELRHTLRFVCLDSTDRQLLKRVIDSSRDYFDARTRNPRPSISPK